MSGRDIFASALLVAIGAMGAVIGFGIAHTSPTSHLPVPLTASELKQDLVIQRLVPMDMAVRVKTPFEIHAENKFAFAYTDVFDTPCLIVLPDTIEIMAIPSQRWARFVSQWDADAVAHEMLHCVRGHWHPP